MSQQIIMPTKKEKKPEGILGTIGSIGGGIIGGIYGGPGGASAGAGVGGQVGGMLDSAGAKPAAPVNQGAEMKTSDAIHRKLAEQEGDTYSQLKVGLMSVGNLPPEQRIQYGKPIMDALQKIVSGQGNGVA